MLLFKYFRKYSYTRVNKSESYLNSLSLNHQKLFTKYRKHLSDIRNCIDDNQSVIDKMIRDHENIFRPNPGDMIVSQQDVRDLKGQTKNLRHQDMENVSMYPFNVLFFNFHKQNIISELSLPVPPCICLFHIPIYIHT